MKKHQWALYSSFLVLAACGGSDESRTASSSGNASIDFDRLLSVATEADAEASDSEDYIPEEEQEEETEQDEAEEAPEVIEGFFDNTDSSDSLLQRLADEGGFDVFIRLSELSGLADLFTESLNNEQQLTLLIPSDDAFSNLSEEELETLSSDAVLLRNFLRNHIIVDENLDNTDLNQVAELRSTRRFIRSALGEDIAVTGIGRTLFFNLSPGEEYDGQVGSITFHRLGRVIFPAEDPEVTPSLDRFLLDDGRFGTLRRLLIDTGLDELLLSFERGFTLFAPTDDAFEQLDEGVITELSNDPEALIALLSNHAIGNRRLETNRLIAFNGRSLRSLGEEPLLISVRDGRLIVNGVNVIEATGLQVESGVVYPLGQVLIATEETEVQEDEEAPEDAVEESLEDDPSEEEIVVESDDGSVRVVTSISFDREEAEVAEAAEEASSTEEEALPSDKEDPWAVVVRLTQSQLSRVLDYLPSFFQPSQAVKSSASLASSEEVILREEVVVREEVILNESVSASETSGGEASDYPEVEEQDDYPEEAEDEADSDEEENTDDEDEADVEVTVEVRNINFD